jgi:wyosine [tRNA(Phe)-imidazoG37] synthetase (radical SAM superfamily)
MPEVRDALMDADMVLPSLDAGDKSLFQHINRPHGNIVFESMIEGLAEFTKIFPGSVWLEVFLLAGMSGLPFEAVKIAALTGHIHPERVQLNTVCRPPAEEFASSLSREQLLALKKLFPGLVEIISENIQNDYRTSALWKPGVKDIIVKDIMALLSRRPCTTADVARGLGMHILDALKHLEALRSTGKAKTLATGGQHFYVASRVEKPSRQ